MVDTVLSSGGRGGSARNAILRAALLLGLVPGIVLGQVAPDGSAEAGECPQGRVGDIEIRNGPVFEPAPSQTRVLRFAQSVANFVHIRTRQSVIRDDILLRKGDCLDPFMLSESERVLNDKSYLAQSRIQVVEQEDGNHTLVVHTRDEWSLEVSLRTSYDEGLNLERLRFNQRNFLGRGVVTRGSMTRFRDDRSQHVQLIIPRVIGRLQVETFLRDAPRGWWILHGYVHPFSNELDRVAWKQVFTWDVAEFSFFTGNRQGLTQVNVPLERTWHDWFAMYRFGEPGNQFLIGVGLVHHDVRYTDAPLGVFNGQFKEVSEIELPEMEAIERQLQGERATRLSLHMAVRRYTFAPFVGLDSPRGRQSVPLGWYVGAGVGTGFKPGQEHIKLHANMGARVGDGVLKALVNVDSGLGGDWRDLIAEGHVVTYLRHRALPYQTFFLMASAAGGWNTQQPFQLNLGGRQGVRSLPGFANPGGARVLFVAENRIALPWPQASPADFGVTLFADAGRTWAGDVPFGQGSDRWLGSVGAGLRIAFPSGSRNTLRPDIVFPVGHSSQPMFRVAYEVYRVRSPFSAPGIERSRWLGRGVEQF